MTHQRGFTRNFLPNEIFNSQVEEYLENQGDTEQGEEIPIVFGAYFVLNNPVNAEHIEGFDNNVQNDKKSEVCNEFPFQKQLFSATNVISYG
jgi:hypothetical protein